MARFLLPLIILVVTVSTHANELAYVKTDTPRDTMETFYRAMQDYREGVATDDPKKKLRIADAIRCFAEKDDAVITSQREKELAAIFLKEVIDRVILIDFDKIPKEDKGNRWRMKNTEIVLKPVKSGEREGEWLITEGTWRRAQLFYLRVVDMPYVAGSGEGALYIQPWMEKYLPTWSKREVLGLKNWQWIGMFVGLLLGLLLKFLVQNLIAIIKNIILSSRFQFQKEVISAIEKPAALMITAAFWWGWLIYLKLEGLAYGIVNGIIQITFGVAATFAAYSLVSVFARYFEKLTQKTESTLDDQLVPFAEKTIKMIVVLLGSLLVLQNMGVNVFSILAGLGLGGLAFALAAQDTAANLFGSIMILIDRPFQIGDWIKVGNVEGTVEEIGFRSTRVRTFYSSLITVPNAQMAKVDIDNLGMRRYRRCHVTLDIIYGTPVHKIEKFVDGIRDILKSTDGVRKDYFNVYFNDFGASSLKVMVYFFFDLPDWPSELETRQKVFLDIFRLAEDMGVEFAFPTQTLYLNQDNPPSPEV